ncbi:MAG: DUF2723 domain-containing protein [Candidatus Kapaibacterium sp.]
MNYRTLNKVFAATVFFVALTTYWMTLQPSVPFWDCGEFSAAAMWQQVPHPPGAPLWLLVAKTFEILLPGDPGHNFNLFAALCSAFAAMFAYLIAVNGIERFRPYDPSKPASSYLSTYGGGLIGALAFVWSDSNWFNSVESEVYSAATLLAALAMWIMMKWDQQAEKPGHERWLLLLAYVMGMAIGVHLLALLVIPSVALTIYFRRYTKIDALSVFLVLGLLALIGATFIIVPFRVLSLFAFVGLVTVVVVRRKSHPDILPLAVAILLTGVSFGILYTATLTWIPEIFSSTFAGGIVLLLALLGLAGWAFVQKKGVVFLAATAFTLTVLGYTTYTQILVRSASHPVMNENEPDTFSELARYLGREQYGSRAAWPRRHDHVRGGYYQQALQPYGPLPQPVGQNPDGSIEWANIDAPSEINYMVSYQMMHMYFRYLGWNFIGRVSDIQDAGVSMNGSTSVEEQANFIRPTGAEDVFPITFFAIPFLLGLFGIFVHFRRDWKMATIFMTAFLLWGVLMALQQNQQNPQPRERDYFYTASFMVFSLWVGFGAFGLAEAIGKKNEGSEDEDENENSRASAQPNVAISGAVLGICLLAAPVLMAVQGWKLHDRSGNWLPWDYAYNLLQSCDTNAILFTNGDNDTFPVWYLQDVAGVRRDIRVVNLELAQTPWYITQMKQEPTWDAAPVPMTFTLQQIKDKGDGRNEVNPTRGAPTNITLPVPADVMKWATNGAVTSGGEFNWTYEPGEGGVFSPKNQIVRSIVVQTAKEGWKRPIFFSLTTGNEYAGLYPFLRQEGMALRVMPVEQKESIYNLDVMKKCLMETLPGDEYFTDQHYGFKFRGLNDPNANFLGQEDHRRPINFYYHQLYIRLTEQLLYGENDPAGAVAVLDKMVETIPPNRFGPPIPYLPFMEEYGFLTKIAELYRDAGATEKAREWAQKALDDLNGILQSGGQARFDPRNPQDYTAVQVQAKTTAILGNYSEALSLYERMLQEQPNNQPVQVERDALLIEQALSKKDSAAARKILTDALTSYGSNLDQRARLLLSRFPSLAGNLAAEPDNANVAAGADTGKK